MDTSKGFARIYRRVLDDPTFRSEAEALGFVWLILRAAWKPTTVRYKERIIKLERGQLATSLRDMARALEWSKNRVSRFLNTLADRDMIGTAGGTGVTVITICKYDEYQSKASEAGTAADPEPGQGRDSAGTQNNEGNEGKEDNWALPANFEMPDEWIGWAMNERDWDREDAWAEAASFIGYWSDKGTKRPGWKRSWQTWMRKSFRRASNIIELPIC